MQSIKKLISKFSSRKMTSVVLLAALLLIVPLATHADPIVDTALTVFGALIFAAVWLLGKMILGVILAVIYIAQYNNFINSLPVTNGWLIVRDICNMFFILILLVIAFATILRIPQYSIKSLLARTVIFAVLINFSKTICGLLIDFSQVIMLTFVNGFKDIGAANFTSLLGVQELLSMNFSGALSDANTIKPDAVGGFSIVGSYLLALVYCVVMLVVMIALLATLVYRLVILWIYIILSPLAYLSNIAPGTQSMWKSWWKEFTAQLTAGPLLAFFIWLSLATLGQFSDDSAFKKGMGLNNPANAGDLPQIGLTQVGSVDHIMRFVISIGLLVGGLIATKSLGGIAGSAAGAAMGRLQKGASLFKNSPKKVAKSAYNSRIGMNVRTGALGALKPLPIVGAAATRAQARLKMQRESADEKETKYMKFATEKDLQRMARRRGPLKDSKYKGWLFESTRQDNKKAITEKIRRGVDQGPSNVDPNGKSLGREESNLSVAAVNKTQDALRLLRASGHSLDRSGGDVFTDEENGKKALDYLKKNPGHIDEGALKDYYTKLNADGLSKYGKEFEVNGLGDGEQWKKEIDPETNEEKWVKEEKPAKDAIETFAKKMSQKDLEELHYTQLNSRVLDAVAGSVSNPVGPVGPVQMKLPPKTNKKIARIYDNGTEKQKEALETWAKQFDRFVPSGDGVADMFGDRVPGIGGNGGFGRIGKSFMLKNSPEVKPEVASGITGLNNINKGRFSVDFAELNMPEAQQKAAGIYVSDPQQKAQVVEQMSDKMRREGMPEDQVTSLAGQLNNLSYLMLRNKGQNVDLATSKAAQAHEMLHARLDQNFTKDQLKGIWDSLDEDTKNDARQKVKATWGNDASEDAVIDEYFAEGLRSKTRWNKDADVKLSGKAEAGMNQILAPKGTSVDHMVATVTDTKPVVSPAATPAEAQEEVAETLSQKTVQQAEASGNANPSEEATLVEAVKDLTKKLGDIGNSFEALAESSRSSMDSLEHAIKGNGDKLLRHTDFFRKNTDALKDLSKTVKYKEAGEQINKGAEKII